MSSQDFSFSVPLFPVPFPCSTFSPCRFSTFCEFKLSADENFPLKLSSRTADKLCAGKELTKDFFVGRSFVGFLISSRLKSKATDVRGLYFPSVSSNLFCFHKNFFIFVKNINTFLENFSLCKFARD